MLRFNVRSLFHAQHKQHLSMVVYSMWLLYVFVQHSSLSSLIFCLFHSHRKRVTSKTNDNIIIVRRRLVLRARFTEFWGCSLLFYAPIFFLFRCPSASLCLKLQLFNKSNNTNQLLHSMEEEGEIAHNLLTFKFIPIFLLLLSESSVSIASFVRFLFFLCVIECALQEYKERERKK